MWTWGLQEFLCAFEFEWNFLHVQPFKFNFVVQANQSAWDFVVPANFIFGIIEYCKCGYPVNKILIEHKLAAAIGFSCIVEFTVWIHYYHFPNRIVDNSKLESYKFGWQNMSDSKPNVNIVSYITNLIYFLISFQLKLIDFDQFLFKDQKSQLRDWKIQI